MITLDAGEPHNAGHKWLIFDRTSVLIGRAFQPYREWIEFELAYDIAGLRENDQDAVLTALSKQDLKEENTS
ncbi:MAG: hypothetical protein M3460_15415 [Actinomycetota bacterium]|nr:hypothetical protein [Actinomycetota bacterium]